MKPNVMLNLVGITLILIAGAGMAVVGPEVHEGPEVPKIEYNVAFGSSTKTGPVAGGTLNDGASTMETIEIIDDNLTSLEISITWSDNFVPAATAGTLSVTVSVSGPDGQSESHTSSGSSDSFTFLFDELNIAYEDLIKELEEDADEDAWLSEEYPGMTLGTGTWEISITMDRSRPTIIGGRGSMDFNINTNYDYFKGSIVEVTDEE
jgi:hypothetical protein